MSTSLKDSMAMSIAAERSSGKTIIGYNYTKNPAVPQARRLIEDGVIGRVAGFFCRYDVERETDEQRPWSWRMSRNMSGTGGNGDVLSHVISVANYLTGTAISRVVGDIGASRVIWGKKCGLTWEIQGTKGAICYDQERLNEIRLFTKSDNAATDGFKIILTGPYHPPYEPLLPNGGLSLGYMDEKICELHELLSLIQTDGDVWPDFTAGLKIEKVMDAVDRSTQTGNWENVE